MVIFTIAHGGQPVQRLGGVLGAAHVVLVYRGKQGFAVHLVGVAGRDVADAKFVGRHKKLAVRHALGHPQAAGSRRGGGHFHNPGFVFVGHGQGFARPVVAILLNERAHQLNGLAGGFAAFQRHARQLGRIENALARLCRAGIVRPIRAFAKHEAMLVHDGVVAVNIGKGVPHLRDKTDGNRARRIRVVIARRALGVGKAGNKKGIGGGIFLHRHGGIVHGALRAFRPVAGGNVHNGLVVEIVVVRMAYHHGAIGAGSFGDNKGGAGKGCLRQQQGQRNTA